MSSDWPFDLAPNVAAITTVGVIERNLPILVVQHDDETGWAFLCGTTNDTSDGRVIGMGTALRKDPSLAGIADLPAGWTARRAAVGSDWHRHPDS